MSTVRWRFLVAYDGSAFRGFARQHGQSTVAGVLEEALGRIGGEPVTLTCAGRTDAGVHAEGQVVHVDLPASRMQDVDVVALMRSLNRQCGPAVAVRAAERAPDGFDTRYSARWRHYRYLVLEAPTPDPLLANLAWHVAGPLDVRTMAAAADAVLGEHDFRAFCRRRPGTSSEEPIPRRVLEARWTVQSAAYGFWGPDRVSGTAVAGVGSPAGGGGWGWGPDRVSGTAVAGRLLRFDIVANAFCHQMVRSLVGALVDVGNGKKKAADMVLLLRSTDRRNASQPSPPHGLCLMSVGYEPWPPTG